MLKYKTIHDKPCSDHEGNIYQNLIKKINNYLSKDENKRKF